MKPYAKIAERLEVALEGQKIPAAMGGAIRVMKLRPDLCGACFDEALWSIIEDYLNDGGEPTSEDHFIGACALLEEEVRR